MTEQPAALPQSDGTAEVAGGTLVFFCGADMNPIAIHEREGFAEARFVDIGRAPGSIAGRAGLPAALAADDIWGIIVRLPGDGLSPGEPVTVTLHDGSEIEAVLATGPATAGNAEAILAAARYWELPAPYRRTIEGAQAG